MGSAAGSANAQAQAKPARWTKGVGQEGGDGRDTSSSRHTNSSTVGKVR